MAWRVAGEGVSGPGVSRIGSFPVITQPPWSEEHIILINCRFAYYWRIVSFVGIRQNGHGAVTEICNPFCARSGKARQRRSAGFAVSLAGKEEARLSAICNRMKLATGCGRM